MIYSIVEGCSGIISSLDAELAYSLLALARISGNADEDDCCVELDDDLNFIRFIK